MDIVYRTGLDNTWGWISKSVSGRVAHERLVEGDGPLKDAYFCGVLRVSGRGAHERLVEGDGPVMNAYFCGVLKSVSGRVAHERLVEGD